MLRLQSIPGRRYRWPLAVVFLALVGCGGGGGDGDDGGSNQSPVASFTATPSSGQAPLTVAFDATGSSDPDGSISGYSWAFGDGQTGAGATVSHTYAAAGAFTASLTVTDNRGATGGTSRGVVVTGQQPPVVTVSGRITFERVPFATQADRGLDYTQTVVAPAREIVVELLRASNGAVLATAGTDVNGRYSLSAPSATDVRLRAKALTRAIASSNRPASWDIRVLDNTDGNALYVLDGAVFNSGAVAQTRNLLATTGWGGTFAGVYTGVRAAAPFALLDTLYSAAQFLIAQGDASVQLPPLAAYWSGDNRPSNAFNPASGDIQTTQFISAAPGVSAPGMYVLGLASTDTDEFDQHVLAHEFLHYLEDTVSRTDTVGGAHSLGERLDPRVAFSEGFGNAFSAMVLADPLYRDSFGTAQGSDFGFDVENEASSAPGWYSEDSVHRIVWDLYDSANDGADTDAVALGYGPLHDVFRNELRTGVPLTSVFPFVAALKQRPSAPLAAIDARVAAERVAGTSMGIDSVNMDAYATTETHSGVAAASADLVLPVYAPIVLNGPSVRLCAAVELRAPDGSTIEGSYNKLGNRRFLRFAVPSDRTIDIRVSCSATDTTCVGTPVPDPDFVLRRGSTSEAAESTVPNVERLQISAEAGDHVLEIYEFSHVDLDTSTRRGRTCMTVTITG